MKTKRPYAEALAIADDLLTLLHPACERIAIAGSLRRKRPEVGDLEIVAIPKTEPITDLFGTEVGRASLVDDVLVNRVFTKNGEKYKQFAYQDMTVDLFLATPETWGVIYTIRTGPWEYAKWLVTSRYAGGAMPGTMRCQDGRLWQSGAVLDTPEEADVFKALGLEFVPPERRVAPAREATT